MVLQRTAGGAMTAPLVGLISRLDMAHLQMQLGRSLKNPAGRRYDRLVGWVGDLQPYLDRLDAKKLYSTLPIVVVIDDGNGYRSVYAHFGKIVLRL